MAAAMATVSTRALAPRPRCSTDEVSCLRAVVPLTCPSPSQTLTDDVAPSSRLRLRRPLAAADEAGSGQVILAKALMGACNERPSQGSFTGVEDCWRPPEQVRWPPGLRINSCRAQIP